MAEIVDLYARERLLGFELTPGAAEADGRPGASGWTARRRGAAGARDHGRRPGGLRAAGARAAGPSRACPSSWSSRRRTATARTSDEDSEQPPAGGDEDAEGEGEGEEQQQSAAAGRARQRRRATSPRSRPGQRQLASRARARPAARTMSPRSRAPTGRSSCRRAARPWPTRCSRPSSTRWSRSRSCAARQRAHPPARPARPVADPLPGHDRPHGQPAAAQADGAAAALLVVRPRRGHPRHRPPVAGGDQPGDLALVQDGGRDRVPRHRGLAADRQFGLDARPADRGGRHECRHPGPHARALRGQGRDPGLHHPGLEGRPVARGLAARRQARQSRPAQRPAPHRLQAGRRALAPGAPLARPDAARGPAQGEHRRRGHPVGASPPAPAAPSSAAS